MGLTSDTLEVLWQETEHLCLATGFLCEVGDKWARRDGAGTLRSREV